MQQLWTSAESLRCSSLFDVVFWHSLPLPMRHARTRSLRRIDSADKRRVCYDLAEIEHERANVLQTWLTQVNEAT